jgi:hypothetical protein
MKKESRYDHRRFGADGRCRADLKPVGADLVHQAKGQLARRIFSRADDPCISDRGGVEAFAALVAFAFIIDVLAIRSFCGASGALLVDRATSGASYISGVRHSGQPRTAGAQNPADLRPI